MMIFDEIVRVDGTKKILFKRFPFPTHKTNKKNENKIIRIQ